MKFKFELSATKEIDLERDSFPDLPADCSDREFAEYVAEYYHDHPEDVIDSFIEWIAEGDTLSEEVNVEAT